MSLADYWRWQAELYDYQEEEMTPIYVTQGEQKDFTPCPEGLHQAVCVDVIDKGMVDGIYGKKHKLVLVWQVLPTDDDGKALLRPDGGRFQVQKWYTASIHKKSNLCRDLQIWRGKAFTKEEAEKFDVEKLIGANCQIQVIHSAPKEDGAVYANMQAIVPHKGKDKAVALDYVRVKDREPGDNGNGHASEEDDDDSVPF